MFLSTPARALLPAADEGATENLWTDCEILDHGAVCLPVHLTRGWWWWWGVENEPRLSHRQAGLVSDRKLSKEWSCSV